MKTLSLTIMSFIQKNWSLVFALVSVVVIIHLMFDQTANASSPFLQIDKNTYVKGDVILVYGSVGSYVPNTLVTIQVLDNNNTQLLALTTNPKPDTSFLVRIPTNGTDWKTGGPYDVKVQYGTCCYVGDSTFLFYADQLLPPLKQTEAGIPFWDIKCDSGLVTIMKQEDGTVVCVRPGSLQKLISLNWGYDPSEKLTVYGLKDVYQAGQEIDFKFRINGFGGYCDYQPSITVKDYDQKIVWQSPLYAVSCPASEGNQSGHREDEAFLGSEAHLGYDYNNYGPLIIKKTGTYSMNISWLDGNITKEFTVIANQTSSNQNSNSSGTQPNPMIDLKNDTGIVTLGNQTYYFDTPNYTKTVYVQPAQISFHDVIFTLFPSGFRGGLPIPCNLQGSGGYYWADAKFTDDTHELLHIFANFQPCTTNSIPTMFSTHTNPQAGLTFYDGKMRLLVSVENQTYLNQSSNSTVSNGPEFKLGPDLLGPIPHQLVFFMKSNSTAKIFVEYTSNEPNIGTMQSWSSVYVGKTDYTPLNSSDVTISANPSSIPLTQGSNTTVVYSVTAKEGVKGVYWIFLAQFCRVMPVAIDIDSLTISPSDIPVQMGMTSCPAQLLDGKILGISGGTAEYKIGQPVS